MYSELLVNIYQIIQRHTPRRQQSSRREKIFEVASRMCTWCLQLHRNVDSCEWNPHTQKRGTYFKQVVILSTSIKRRYTQKTRHLLLVLITTVLSVLIGLFDAFLGKQHVYWIVLIYITHNCMQIICHDARMSV